jgi:hypothetical protein
MDKLKELVLADDPGNLSVRLYTLDHMMDLAASGDRDAADILLGEVMPSSLHPV